MPPMPGGFPTIPGMPPMPMPGGPMMPTIPGLTGGLPGMSPPMPSAFPPSNAPFGSGLMPSPGTMPIAGGAVPGGNPMSSMSDGPPPPRTAGVVPMRSSVSNLPDRFDPVQLENLASTSNGSFGGAPPSPPRAPENNPSQEDQEAFADAALDFAFGKKYHSKESSGNSLPKRSSGLSFKPQQQQAPPPQAPPPQANQESQFKKPSADVDESAFADAALNFAFGDRFNSRQEGASTGGGISFSGPNPSRSSNESQPVSFQVEDSRPAPIRFEPPPARVEPPPPAAPKLATVDEQAFADAALDFAFGKKTYPPAARTEEKSKKRRRSSSSRSRSRGRKKKETRKRSRSRSNRRSRSRRRASG